MNRLEIIYHLSKMEKCNFSMNDINILLNSKNLDLDNHEVNIINNLNNAYNFINDNLNEDFDLNFVKNIHHFVGYNEALKWGILRDGNVGINGVNYIPEIPDELKVIKEMDNILKEKNIELKAIRYMLWGMRSQLFWDGNKRTSIFAANHILMSQTKTKKSIVIKEDILDDFHILLSDFYETNNMFKIENFIKDNCIYSNTNDLTNFKK